MKLYHYTTVDAFTKIWMSQELLFHKYQNMNYLYERQKFAAIEIPGRIHIPQNIKTAAGGPLGYFFSVLSKYKQISFCKDYKTEFGCFSPMMWGLYAKNENGVCIEFNSQKLFDKADVFSGIVSYKPVKVIPLKGSDFESEVKIEKAIMRNRKEIFFAKHPHWKSENEYRVISRTQDSLSIKNSLSCIYIQDPINKEAELMAKLVNMLVDKEGIPIHYIHVREKNGCTYLSLKNL